MDITTQQDGIFILGHGVLSVSQLAAGVAKVDPCKLGLALAKINRYAGNTEVPWNDAEHSMLVSKLIPSVAGLFPVREAFTSRATVVDREELWNDLFGDPDRAFAVRCMAEHWALLHDVVEVIVGDTPNPVKKETERRHMAGRYSGSVEDDIVRWIKDHQLGQYATRLALGLDGGKEWGAIREAILNLLQDLVKPADKLALLIEMRHLHHSSVLDYVRRVWQVPANVMHFVYEFKWARLRQQRDFENIDWRTSAREWTLELALSSERLEVTLGS